MLNGLKFREKIPCILHAHRMCGFVLIIYAFGIPSAYADDVSMDPFDFDASHWISFDHYKEKTKHGHEYVEEAPAATTPATQPSSTEPVALAAPTRPLNPPLMPGVNKDFNIAVTSTADDTGPMAEITNLESKPTVQLPGFSWQNASSAAKQYADNPNDTGVHPLGVRMSYLPESRLKPKIKPTPNSTQARLAAARAQQKEVAAKKVADDAAACAALDAYKKQQLDAIQSDRQTLQALQSVITQLGLQKQLNFMTGANGSVANADNDTSNVKVDIPAASTVK